MGHIGEQFGWRQVFSLFITFALFDRIGTSIKRNIAQWLPISITTILVILLAFGTFVTLSLAFEWCFRKRLGSKGDRIA
jgi:hypothetical protein